MDPITTLFHLLNFAAPALALAAGVTLGAHFFMKKRPPALALPAQFTINLIVSAVALVIGLLLLGRDGKMASYAAMALTCATSQWLMARGWQR
jgi:sorbitol-specific phosphotransferase system component IIBC